MISLASSEGHPPPFASFKGKVVLISNTAASCEVTVEGDFPITSEARAKGKHAQPFFQWPANELGASAKPGWNLQQQPIAADRRSVEGFSTGTSPISLQNTRPIENRLSERHKTRLSLLCFESRIC